MKDPRQAQSIMEYMVLIAAVIVVLILFLKPWGSFSNKVKGYVDGLSNQINDMADQVNMSQYK